MPSSPTEASNEAALADMASAKRWMNGWVKSGVASVTGILENISAPPALQDLGLGTVREEEEEDLTSQSETDSRRTSSTSATSVDHDDLLHEQQASGLPSSYTSSPISSPASSLTRIKDDPKHARRRSTFDMFESWGKRFSDLHNSDR
jgi:hypothetical protein